MRITKHQLTLFTCTLLAISVLTGIHVMELRGEEPRRAVIALEMMINGDYIKPTLLGWNYYNKPPVYNWILVLFFSVFQTASEFVVRLPGVLSYLLTGYGIYRLTAANLDKEQGIIAALLFLVSIDLYFYGTVVAGEIDLFYTLLLFGQWGAVFHFHKQKNWLMLFLISYALAGVGMLTKGLPSLFHQGVTLIALAIYYRDRRFLFSWQHAIGIFLFLSIFCGYYLIYNTRGEAINFLVTLFYESQNKSGVDNSLLDVGLGLVMFPLQFLFILLPGSLLVLLLFSKKIKGNGIWKPGLVRFSLLIIAVNIIVYWLSPEVRNRYLYILLPFASILLARIWAVRSKLSFNTTLKIILLFIFFRLAYNTWVIPYQQRQFVYRDYVHEMLEKSGEEPIYFHDSTRHVTFLAPSIISSDTIEYYLPANISYRVAYYVTSGNHQILKFVEEPLAGAYHLVRENKASTCPHQLLFVIERGKEDDLELILCE